MKRVREFRLKNEKGQEFSLMDMRNSCLLTDPSGLGVNFQNSFEQIGNKWVETIKKCSQSKIVGQANFINYDNYLAMVKFIAYSKQLKLVYVVPYETGQKTYFRDVVLSQLSKSEKQLNGIISETLEINCLSLWYDEQNSVYNMGSNADENTIIWDFPWNSSFTNYHETIVDYTNQGHVDASIEMEIAGQVSNPLIELFIDGDVYQSITITEDILPFEKLRYCSKENEFEISKILVDGTKESLFTLKNIDFANDNVLRIPPNRSSKIKVSADTDIPSAKLTIYTYYFAI